MTTNSNINISIDTKEPEKVYKAFEKFTELKTERKNLGICDIIVWGNPTWFIERKTVSDFVSTALSKDNRLTKQLEMLANIRNGDKKSAILLTGNPNSALRYRKINKLAYTDLLNSIPIEWGIPILIASWDWQVPYLLRYIAHKVGNLGEEKHEYPLRSSVSSKMTLDEQCEYILEGFPGMGVKTTKALLEEGKSLSNIFYDDYSIDRFKSLKNSKTKEAMRKILYHHYGDKD